MRPCFCTCLRKRGNTNKRGLSPCHTKVFIQGTPVPSSVPVVDLFWRPPSKLPLLARSVPFQLPPPEWKLKKHQLCCVEELEASQSWQSAYVEHGDLRIKVSQIAKQCPNRQAAARSWGWERWEWEGEAARRPEDDKTHSLLLISSIQQNSNIWTLLYSTRIWSHGGWIQWWWSKSRILKRGVSVKNCLVKNWGI